MFSEDESWFDFLFFEGGFGKDGVFFFVKRFGGFFEGSGFLEGRRIGLHGE